MGPLPLADAIEIRELEAAAPCATLESGPATGCFFLLGSPTVGVCNDIIHKSIDSASDWGIAQSEDLKPFQRRQHEH